MNKKVYFDCTSKQIDLNEDEDECYTGFNINEKCKNKVKKQNNQLEYQKLSTNFISPPANKTLLNKKRNKPFERENKLKSIKKRHGDNKMNRINNAIYQNIIEVLNANITCEDSTIEGEKYKYEFLKTNRDDRINLKKKESEKRLEQTVEEIVSGNITIQQKNKYNLDHNKILCEKIKKEGKNTIILNLLKIPYKKFYEDFANENCLEGLKKEIADLADLKIPNSYITIKTLIEKYQKKIEINNSYYEQFLNQLKLDLENSINNKNYEFYTRNKYDIRFYNKMIDYIITELFNFFNSGEKDKNKKYYPINKKEILNIEYGKTKKKNKKSKNIINITFKDPHKLIAETILSKNIALSVQKQLKIDKDQNKNLFKNNKNENIKKLSEYSFSNFIFHMMRKGEEIDEGLKIVDFISKENFYKYINEENDVYINDLKFLSENYDYYFKSRMERSKRKKKGKKEEKSQNEE